MKLDQGKVSVHVDVVIGGDGLHSVETAKPRKAFRRTGINPKPFSIGHPIINSIVPVINGMISAQGACLASDGAYPTVWALAYPNTTVNPVSDPDYYEPDWANNPVSYPSTDGTWTYNGNIPGAAAASSMSGPANSTLVIWYEYVYSAFVTEYTAESVQFHGYQAGSQGIAAVLPTHLPAATLVAEFHAALQPLGKVQLKWNGVSWAGESGAHGGAVLSLTRADQVYQVSAAGPAASFIIAGPARSNQPFHWQGEGKAIGNVAGSFKVTITE